METVLDHFQLEFVTGDQLLSKYHDYSISDAGRWVITDKFYKQQLSQCNVGIFITYMPSNFHLRQICALILGIYTNDESNTKTKLSIELLCAKRFFDDKSLSPAFGQYLIYKLYTYLSPDELVIHDVSEHISSYYQHLGFQIDSYITEDRYNMVIPKDQTLSDYFDQSKLYLDQKQSKFYHYIISNPLLLEEALSCP